MTDPSTLPMRPAMALACLAFALMAHSASGQSDAAKAQAMVRYQQGIALYDKGKDEEAYVQFAEAYAVVKTPPILFNLASTEKQTGRFTDAATHFRAYLAWPSHPRITAALRATAQASLTELNARLGHLVLDAPAGAEVSVDANVVVGDSTVDVTPGPHTVTATRGEQRASLQVTAPAGTQTTAHLAFDSVPVLPVVVVPPVRSGPPVSTSPTVEPTSHASYWNGRRTTGVVIAGVGLVGIVMGGAFGAERGSDTSDANAAASNAKSAAGASVPATSVCSHPSSAATAPCAALQNAEHSNNSDATLEAAFLIGGGVLIAAGLATTLWPASSASSGTSLVPNVGPHTAGLQWSGSF